MFRGSKHDVCTPVHHNQYSLHILLPSCLHREGFFYGSTHLPLTSRLSPSHSYLQLEPLPQKHSRPVYTPVWIISFSPSVGAPPPLPNSFPSRSHLQLEPLRGFRPPPLAVAESANTCIPHDLVA